MMCSAEEPVGGDDQTEILYLLFAATINLKATKSSGLLVESVDEHILPRNFGLDSISNLGLIQVSQHQPGCGG